LALGVWLSAWGLVACSGEGEVRADAGSGDAGASAPDGGAGSADAGTSTVPESVRAARRLYPRVFELQTQVIQKTCSPNPGVCHNDNNYPNLRTPGTFLQLVRAPCNVEIPDPTLGWDRCERAGDVVRVGLFSSEVAYKERLGPGQWRLHLRAPAPRTVTAAPRIESSSGEVVLQPVPEWNVELALVEGMAVAELRLAPADQYVAALLDTALRGLVEGDPNRNGVFGAEAGEVPAALVAPGSLERSYLWGRIVGTVPGTRMPVANAPLDDAAYAAIACYIEQAEAIGDDVEAPIDYARCRYAQAPLDPALDR
jgi:hypothetical protein